MRLRILSILTLVLLARFVFAQTITKAEYYIDADPGFGKGTPFSITSGDSVVGSFSLNLTGISPGFHTFFNRYQMSTGQWGFSEAMVFFINSNVLDTSVHINGMQYYFDSPASTTTTKFANTDSLNITQLISTAGLAPGVHDVSIRYLYNNGYKGFWESLPFVVQGNVIDTSVHIDKVEYYTDKDNGFGKGTVSSVANLDSVNTTYSISTIGFKPSMHDVFVRYHYTNGQWGFAENSYYFPISGANDTSVHITNVEFFFDKDPGPTFGTSTSISPVDTMTSAYPVLVGGLTMGFHSAYLRYAYSDGTNGFAEGAPFYVFNSNRDNVFQPLVTLEYFIDKNDSVGKGTTITFTPNPADSIDLTVDIPLNSNLKQDSHTFFIRAINSGGIASADAKGRFVYGQLTAIENPSTNDLSYLKLYPNPAHDFITIESAKGDIEIVNITGQTLLKQHITSVGDIYKIDISNLANGLYFIKLIDGDNATTKKFIKR